jgi:hypothetical protein
MTRVSHRAARAPLPNPGTVVPFVRPASTAAGHPAHRPRYSQPQRFLVESYAPANRYERELVDLLIAPSLAHFADVLLLREGADQEKPTGKAWWPPEMRDWVMLWPVLLQAKGTHQTLAVAWWSRLSSAQRRALREYLNIDVDEYDPNIGPDLALWEMLAWDREKQAERAAAAVVLPATAPTEPAVSDTTPREAVGAAPASLW